MDDARITVASGGTGLLNTPINVKPKRVVLTPNRQAALILAYKQLPHDRAARLAQLKELCAEYGVSTRLPARLCRKVNGTKKLPTRKGKGGRKLRITPAVAEELKSVLKRSMLTNSTTGRSKIVDRHSDGDSVALCQVNSGLAAEQQIDSAPPLRRAEGKTA